MRGGGVGAHDNGDVFRKRVTEDLLTRSLAAGAEMGLEVGYKGSSLHWCGLINHCPLPPPWVEGLFLSVFRAFSVATCLQIIRCPGKEKKKKSHCYVFLGPTDMKSHGDINEDFINLHGCPVSAEQFVFGDICSVSVALLWIGGLSCAGLTPRNVEPRTVDVSEVLSQASLRKNKNPPAP